MEITHVYLIKYKPIKTNKMKKEKTKTIAEKIEIEMNKDYSFSSREIISFWQDDNFVNFEIVADTGQMVEININAYEFLQWFDKNKIDEIKNKVIENLKNK
jgi:hypothetical protein